jgi:hypothetical protein
MPNFCLRLWLERGAAVNPRVMSAGKSGGCIRVARQPSMKAAIRSRSKRKRGANCHRSGPSFSPRFRRPCAKKFASGASTSVSFLLCVMKRELFTAKMKSSGTVAAHDSNNSGRWSE